mmetsp:Transcript_42405/g.105991  ORF Transcript_42405/g.105991 Transcript_42405/m.105991 type:complete len:257 (+) Transcript_42405:1648-2418(+)
MPLVVLTLVDPALHAAIVLQICVTARLVPLANGHRSVLALIILAHKVSKSQEIVVHARLLGATRVPRALIKSAHDVTLDVVVGVPAVLGRSARRRALIHGAHQPIIIHLAGHLHPETRHSVLLLVPLRMTEHVRVPALLLREARRSHHALILLANHLSTVDIQPVHILAPPLPTDVRGQEALVDATNLAECVPRQLWARILIRPHASKADQVVIPAASSLVVVVCQPVALRHALHVVDTDLRYSPALTLIPRHLSA